MKIDPYIQMKLKALEQICQRYGVVKLYAFGSIVNGRFNPTTSDIDLIVEINEKRPIERGKKLLDLWDELEDLFDRKVDLISNPEIENPYLRKTIDRSKVLLYDGSSQKIRI